MNKKIIWITGASTGIGKALAIKFANNGWNVAASARREELLNELNKSLALQNMSMGMSADYIEAIKHGSNFVRIGSSIFGSRS